MAKKQKVQEQNQQNQFRDYHEDEVKILKVSQDSYLIYEGTPSDQSGITKVLRGHRRTVGGFHFYYG